MRVVAAVAVAIAAGRALLALVRARRHPVRAEVTIASGADHTEAAPSGAVRSTQAAEIVLPEADLDAIWTPMHLERLARTYWRFLSRVTLGLVRVAYTPAERFVVLGARPLVLLGFRAPEYLMDGRRAIVRWRIERGLLVARAGRGGDGYLQIDVRRGARRDDGRVTARVEVEVANFHPAIASGLSRWAYAQTQSRIHVVVTHGFLRSLARLDLAESRIGRYAEAGLPEVGADRAPDPSRVP